MLILILLDQNSNDFHQGNQGRILIFTHFINQIIQYSVVDTHFLHGEQRPRNPFRQSIL